ncbi:MAG: hypothetical protein U0903_04640 [Planctomycetales bacterium]
MELSLIGYFLRRTKIPPNWEPFLPSTLTEVCTVSHCMNPPSEGWINRWLHNDLGFFNTQADALSMTVDSPHEHHLFAYRLLLVRFDRGNRDPISLPELAVEYLSNDFVSLGFDVVSKSVSAFFECSPLSCNGLSKEFPVNRFCLLSTLAEAEAFAEHCSREEPEPGPYYVVEVMRENDLGNG